MCPRTPYTLAGAQEQHRKFGAAPAPAPGAWHRNRHPGAAIAPGPASWADHDEATDADVLFILSAEQVMYFCLLEIM
jgi:hypothetical protein